MRINLSLSQKAFLLVLLPLSFELLFVGALFFLLKQSRAIASMAQHSKSVIASCDAFIYDYLHAGQSLLVFAFTHSDESLARHKRHVNAIPPRLLEIRTLVRADAKQLQLAKEIDVLSHAVLEEMSVLRDIHTQGRSGASALGSALVSAELRTNLNELAALVWTLEEIERRRASYLPSLKDKTSSIIDQLLVLGLTGNVLLAVLLTLGFNRSTLRRLKILMDNTDRLAGGKRLNPPVSGADEIAQLDQVFHAMAATLEDAARKERAIIENAQDVICSFDAEGRFTAVSPAVVKVWGYDADELLGRHCDDFLVNDHDGCPRFPKATQPFTPTFENRFRRKDGEVLDLLWSIHWSDKDQSFFCVTHDISERKRAEKALKASEERTRSIIVNMPVGLITVNPEGEIESVNPRTEAIFACPASSLEGQSVFCLISDAKPELKEFSQLLGKASGRVVELKGKRGSGESFPLELSVNELKMSNGIRYLINIQDVTELHEVERLKQEFIAMVSHELRTPLTAIMGFLSMLDSGVYGPLSAVGKDRIQATVRGTDRLITLLNDLLDSEKMLAGKLEMNMGVVSLEPILIRSREAVLGFAEKLGVVIQIDPGDLEVFGDDNRLVQVVVNLLSNAIKFSPRGSTVRVSQGTVDDWVEVRVIDQGRGIAEKYREAIFQRFRQVNRSDATEKGGTGLGLALCKAIVEQHGGTIGVESEEGQGSTFWFRVRAVDSMQLTD